MSWVWISRQLIINIVVFQSVYKCFYQDPIQIESAEVIHRVLGWQAVSSSRSSAEPCSGTFAHLGNLSCVVGAECALVSHIAYHHSFSCDRWNKSIQKQQHYTIIIVHLN